MKVKSCYSIKADPYKAGLEIGNALSEIDPEVVFIFPTIHYKGSYELVEAIYDILESYNTIIIGNTGEGFYEAQKVANIGVSALGINSNGKIKWHLEYERNIGKTPFDSTKLCLTKLNKKLNGVKPSLYFLTTDFRTDTNEIEKALGEYALAPVIGGSAGDDNRFKECFVYSNREILTDSIVILAVEGPLKFDISIANNFNEVGKPGKVSNAEGTMVKTINGFPAMDFVTGELGRPLETVDAGSVVLKLTDPKHEKENKIRALLLTENVLDKDELTLFGSAKENEVANVCIVSAEKIIKDVKDIAKHINKFNFTPIAALIVSCAGRKRVLGNDIKEEVKELLRGNNSIKALAGFPSFGEFGPVKNSDGYSKTLFHNMTFILLLIGI
jgi:hypothetical protein